MKKLLIFSAVFIFTSFLIAQVDRTKLPEPGPAPEINLGEYESFTLENGLKVFVVENHKFPRVSYQLIIDRDPVIEGDTAGYISAAGYLLRGGTANRSKDQLDEDIDFIGATLNTSSTGLFAMSLKKHNNKMLEIISDIVLNSKFTQEELDKIKLRMQSDLAAAKDSPNEIAANVRKALVFGKDHPYGELMTEETVEDITLEKTIEYYDTFFRPNISYLAVVGDITVDEIKPLIEKYFGKWERKNVPEYSYEIPSAPSGRKIAIVHRPNSVQSVIEVSYPVQLKYSDPDVLNASLMNTVLGGGVFRLFTNLREEHGYTYGAYSTLVRDEVAGYFRASADVRNEVTDSAVTEILYEMRRLKNEDVPEDELQTVKNYITGNFAMSLERPQTIANFAINTDRYNLPEDFYKNYLKNISEVTVIDVKTAANKFLKPDSAFIIVVGNADEISEGLSKIGEVRYYDFYGNEIDESKLKIPDGLTAGEVIDDYINAIGGSDSLLAVNDRITRMTTSTQGVDIEVSVYQKAPDLFMQEIKAGSMEQEVIFNGEKAVMTAGSNKSEITGDELEKLKYEANLGLIMNLDFFGIKTELSGVENINGKNAYKIKLILPSGKQWYQYYDSETGLKVKEEKTVEVPQGTFTQEIYFDDYRNVKGVKYPYKIRQKLGPQEFTFTVQSIEVNTGLSERNFNIE